MNAAGQTRRRGNGYSMKSVRTKRWASLLAALLLCTLLCAAPVFADEADGGESSTSSTDAAQGDTLAADSFFDQLEAGNGIGTTLFVSGFALAGVGVVGIISLIIWQRASKRRDRVAEDREDIFDEIEQAEIRNRRHREAEQGAREYMENIEAREHDRMPRTTARKYDPAAVTGEIPIVPDRASTYTVERPIVPRTPASMQPNGAQRTAQPAAKRTAARPAASAQAAKPAAQTQKKPAAAQPAARTAAPAKPAAKPAQAKAAAPHKFDLDDILREVRESKNQ